MGNSSSGRPNNYDYNAYQDESASGEVDPYKVLSLPKDFTWDQLKNAYRRVSMQVHPDKGGTPELFNIVTNCFRKLGYEFKARQADKPHHELKRGAQQYYESSPFSPVPAAPAIYQGNQGNQGNQEDDLMPRPPSRRGSSVSDRGGSGGGSFNDKFNRLFDESRLDDEEVASGYGYMMTESTAERDDLKIHKQMSGISNDKFNELFDKTVIPKGKNVVIYKEPEALIMAKSLQFTELGGEAPGDFTRSEQDGSGLQYTDYKVAYTTTRLYDPRAVAARKVYKNVDDYEADRARVVAKGATEEELQYRALKQKAADRAEEERMRRLAERDDRASKHNDKISQRAISLR